MVLEKSQILDELCVSHVIIDFPKKKNSEESLFEFKKRSTFSLNFSSKISVVFWLFLTNSSNDSYIPGLIFSLSVNSLKNSLFSVTDVVFIL